MAVSVSVADLGSLATNDLGCFAVTREMIIVFVAPKAGDKFSEFFFKIYSRRWNPVYGLTEIA